MQRRITIKVSGSDSREFADIVIPLNAREVDVLNHLDLRDCELARREGGVLAPLDNLYDQVEMTNSSTPSRRTTVVNRHP
jgi:hypothetical protein